MKRSCATLLVFALCSVVVRADVTIVQKMTMEGGVMAMAPGGAPSPTTTTRIKGLKARTEIEMTNAPVPVNISTIADLAAKQVILLMHDQKVAQVITAPAGPAATSPLPPGMKIDASVTRSGKSQVIDGFKCEEYNFTTSISMAEMGPKGPPEAAAMMQDLTMKMTGSMWVSKDAPGAAEYRAFQQAMVASQLGPTAMGATGANMPGMEKLMKAMADVDGVAYLTEINMTIEGTGQVADMMRKMGAMRMVTRVTSISASPLSDDLFTIPAGYTKQ